MSTLRLLALCGLLLPLTVLAQTEVPRAFIPSGNGSATSSLAGDPGDEVTEIDGEGFLYRLQFDEQSDRPCFMIAQFWSAPTPDGVNSIDTQSATFNVCRETNNPIQWDHLAGWTPFSLQKIGQPVTASALTLIDQISVIDNGRSNKRIKAVRVRFGDLKAWRLNRSPVNLNLTNYDSFRRPNADGTTFSDHSTCPSGRAAVGLLVYHKRNTWSNRYITGLKLKCAQVRRVDEQPQTTTLQATPRRRVINNR